MHWTSAVSQRTPWFPLGLGPGPPDLALHTLVFLVTKNLHAHYPVPHLPPRPRSTREITLEHQASLFILLSFSRSLTFSFLLCMSRILLYSKLSGFALLVHNVRPVMPKSQHTFFPCPLLPPSLLHLASPLDEPKASQLDSLLLHFLSNPSVSYQFLMPSISGPIIGL